MRHEDASADSCTLVKGRIAQSATLRWLTRNFRVQGTASIVMVHRLTGTGRALDPLDRCLHFRLSPHFPDLRDRGRSKHHRDRAARSAQFASDLARLCDALGFERGAFVGECIGAHRSSSTCSGKCRRPTGPLRRQPFEGGEHRRSGGCATPVPRLNGPLSRHQAHTGTTTSSYAVYSWLQSPLNGTGRSRCRALQPSVPP
jgi:hypothetical protein